MTSFGQKTPRAVIYKSESHKLHQAFCVKAETKIVKGQPVKLEADGTISPYTGTGTYLGIAVTDNINPAYQGQRNFPVEVTVMVDGFAIVNWVAAGDSTPAGYVTPGSDLLNGRYVKGTTSPSETKFIALNAGDTNEVIQVLVK
jgi:hypothetical protein